MGRQMTEKTIKVITNLALTILDHITDVIKSKKKGEKDNESSGTSEKK